jgi:hypothetical protein
MLARMVDRAAADGTVPGRTTRHVPVRFAGSGAGVGELSWGQRELWHAIHMRRTWLPVGGVFPLPTGTLLEDVLADLRFVMSRYPAMRTRLRFDPDRPDRPLQVVHASGGIPLEIVDVDQAEDPSAVADQVGAHYCRNDYDFSCEWPVRTGVIRHRGALTHRVWVMCHLVTDGFGSRVIIEDREARARGLAPGGAGLPPLEQARWQGSPAGQRQCASALRYWEKMLRAVSARRFPAYAGTHRPRYREARFVSRAMFLAVRTICARTGVESASVLLTTFAVALARMTGINPLVVLLVVNNRFRPGLARTVSPLIQPGLCVVDLPDTTVIDAVARIRSRALVAYKHAYHDPPQREELIERVKVERGEEVDLECAFNDRRLTHRLDAGPAPAPEQVRAALPDTVFEWTQQQDERPYDKLYVYVDDVPETIQLTVVTDTHYLAPGDVENCVRTMEQVAVEAALDPAARTGIPAGRNGPRAGPAPPRVRPAVSVPRPDVESGSPAVA